MADTYDGFLSTYALPLPVFPVLFILVHSQHQKITTGTLVASYLLNKA
jgi:hypothetical protein